MQILSYATERSTESTTSHEGKMGLKWQFTLALEVISVNSQKHFHILLLVPSLKQLLARFLLCWGAARPAPPDICNYSCLVW